MPRFLAKVVGVISDVDGSINDGLTSVRSCWDGQFSLNLVLDGLGE